MPMRRRAATGVNVRFMQSALCCRRLAYPPWSEVVVEATCMVGTPARCRHPASTSNSTSARLLLLVVRLECMTRRTCSSREFEIPEPPHHDGEGSGEGVGGRGNSADHDHPPPFLLSPRDPARKNASATSLAGDVVVPYDSNSCGVCVGSVAPRSADWGRDRGGTARPDGCRPPSCCGWQRPQLLIAF